MKHKNKVEKR